MNLTLSYYLWRASRLEPPSKRSRQIAQVMKIEDLFRVPYFLVVQAIACDRIINRLVCHVAQGFPSESEPLVLLFAGPSGHGKTELARKLGVLLGAPLHVVDCTSITNTVDLFGPRKPYTNYMQGSPLNNFLAENSARSCFVFLDEFEKTPAQVQQPFLLTFQSGIAFPPPVFSESW